MSNERITSAGAIMTCLKKINEASKNDEVLELVAIGGMHADWLMDDQVAYAKEHTGLAYQAPKNVKDMEDVLDAMLSATDREQAKKMNFYVKTILYAAASKRLEQTDVPGEIGKLREERDNAIKALYACRDELHFTKDDATRATAFRESKDIVRNAVKAQVAFARALNEAGTRLELKPCHNMYDMDMLTDLLKSLNADDGGIDVTRMALEIVFEKMYGNGMVSK